MLDEREGEVAPGERDRAFNRKPLAQRSAIVAAGPAANLVLAVLLYAAAHWIGIEEPRAVLSTPVAGSLAEQAGLRGGDWVQAHSRDGADWTDVDSMTDLRWQVTQAVLDGRPLHLLAADRSGQGTRSVVLALDTVPAREVDAALMRRIGLGAPYSEPVMGAAREGGPAAAAGLREGDRVLAIDGRPVADAQSLREAIRSSIDGQRGRTMRWEVDREGAAMVIAVTPRAQAEGDALIGRIDAYVGAAPEMVTVRRGPVDGIVQGAARTWEVSMLTLRMLGRMLVGEASVKNLSGPLTIADYAGQSVQQGLAYYLGFLALVSVSLGVLNLLPLPMLDGGHLMYYLFEGVTGRPVSEVWLERLQQAGWPCC